MAKFNFSTPRKGTRVYFFLDEIESGKIELEKRFGELCINQDGPDSLIISHCSSSDEMQKVFAFIESLGGIIVKR